MGTPDPRPQLCSWPARALAVWAAFALLIATGCVTVEPYPSSWGAPPTAGGNCESITGAYADNGTRADGTPVRLSFWLNPTVTSSSPERFQLSKDLAEAEQVELDLKGTLLEISAIGPNVRRAWTFDSSKGQFRCHEGVLRIARWHVDNDIVILANKDTMDLYRTQDYLLVNTHGGGAGLAMVVPVAGYSSVWARFPIHIAANPPVSSGSGVLR